MKITPVFMTHPVTMFLSIAIIRTKSRRGLPWLIHLRPPVPPPVERRLEIMILPLLQVLLQVKVITNLPGCSKHRARGRLIYASACAYLIASAGKPFPRACRVRALFLPGLAGICKNRIKCFWYSVLAELIYIFTSLLIQLIKLFNMTILTLCNPCGETPYVSSAPYSPSRMVRIANILTIA